MMIYRHAGTHSDLHRQQSLAGVFGVNGELNRQGGGHPGGIEAGSAGTDLTGVVGGEHLHLVGAVGGTDEGLNEQVRPKGGGRVVCG